MLALPVPWKEWLEVLLLAPLVFEKEVLKLAPPVSEKEVLIPAPLAVEKEAAVEKGWEPHYQVQHSPLAPLSPEKEVEAAVGAEPQEKLSKQHCRALAA